MPADRLLHPKAGHGRKVTGLTDFEFRVWVHYILTADDFGVMRCSAITLQNASDALAAKKASQVMRALEQVINTGLVSTFEHQGQKYVYQWDWQSWQKVEYPRATDNPRPPGHVLDTCDDSTRSLFLKHPGGTRKRTEGVPNVSQIDPEDAPTTRAGASAKRPTANADANGQRLTAPLVDQREHRKHAHCGRVCLHASLFGEFVRRRNHDGADAEIRDWCMVVEREWAERTDEPGDAFDFWRARYAEKWPPVQSMKKPSRLTAWRPDEAAS